MVWRRLFHRQPNDEQRPAAQPDERTLPPHLKEQLKQRPRRTGDAADLRRRLAALRKRRTDALYDIEQGELALEDDNPWKQRIELLGETLETVEADYAEAEEVEPGPYHPLPETPIEDMRVAIENDVATVSFRVGDEPFAYEEPLDWAERGHQIARTELRRTAGDPSTVVPDNVPDELRDELHSHLENSLFVLATVLRDATLDEEPVPEKVTLADLARPCSTCGGWMDVRGRCQHCARRKLRLQELFRERDRLLSERAAEIEEQHRMAERLPLARRRLNDVEAEIAQIEEQLAAADQDAR
ncbi:MAG TPA: hypothetical protein VGR22_10545 [Thermomicrobiales bacterium]|nr:hypothetical protein [Thermomicrobiales bacterium]